MAVEAHHFVDRGGCDGRKVASGAGERERRYDDNVDFVTPLHAVGSCGPSCVPVRATERGVSFVDAAVAPPASAPRRTSAKRARGDEQFPPGAGTPKRQALGIDPVVLQHFSALDQWRRCYARQVVAAAKVAMEKRLMAKDEQIERTRSLTWVLEERLRGMCAEAHAWRSLALTHEAAVTALRADLDRALEQQALADINDAESCCYGDNNGEDIVSGNENEVGGACLRCGDRSASLVLLLPCRHLCPCTRCAAAASACPSCGCAKNGIVSVNLF